MLDASGLGVNVAGLLAYTPLRHYVMGEASLERAATRPEIDAMTALFRSAMADGAFGFSTSVSQTHAGEGGRPVACRNASRAELAAMSRVLREFDRGVVGVALDSAGWNLISDDELELLRVLAGESGKRVTFLSMLSRPQEPDFHDRTFAKLETLGPLAAQIVPQTSARAIVAQCDLRTPSFLAMSPSFQAAIGHDQKWPAPQTTCAFVGRHLESTRISSRGSSPSVGRGNCSGDAFMTSRLAAVRKPSPFTPLASSARNSASVVLRASPCR